MTLALVVAAVVAFYAFFYRRVVRHWGALTETALRPLGLESSRSIREMESIGKLLAAGVAQTAFAAALIVLAQPQLSTFGLQDPSLLALGVALGIGEGALAGFAGATIMQAGLALRGRPEDGAVWLAEARGGWMGLFSDTLKAAPAWLSAFSVLLYVGGEEIVFRLVLLEIGRDAGLAGAVAVTLSVACFVAVQAFNMPSLRASAFPMAGAAVVGVVHGALFWQVPQIAPLVVAHLTFFAATLLLVLPLSPAPAKR